MGYPQHAWQNSRRRDTDVSLIGDRVRSVSAGSRDLLNVELDHAIALIAAAGEHAPCGHNWPILRKRGRGCAVATLGSTLAGESKLLLTHRGHPRHTPSPRGGT